MIRGWLAGALLCLSLPLNAAERVVSLAPFLTDMVVLLESQSRLVGVLDDPSIPETLRSVPRVGAHQSLSIERIIVRRPDLVLAWTSGNPPELLARLESLGIRVQRFDPRTLVEIGQMTLELGELLGQEQQAAVLSDTYLRELARLRRLPGLAAPAVFVQLWSEPLFTVAGEQLLSDALRHCGARNLFESLPGLAPQVSVEAVLAAEPDMIVALADERKRAAAWLERWQAYPGIPAVRNGRLHAVESDVLVRPTPMIVRGVAQLCRLIDDRGAEGGIGFARLPGWPVTQR